MINTGGLAVLTLITIAIGTISTILVTSPLVVFTLLIMSAPASASNKIASAIALATINVRIKQCLQHGLYRRDETIIEAGYKSRLYHH